MIHTCKQCGAINQEDADKCCFCEESLTQEHALVVSASAGASSAASSSGVSGGISSHSGSSQPRDRESENSWREEVSHKLRSYRARHGGAADENHSQPALPFDASEEVQTAGSDDGLDDPLQTALASAAARLEGENQTDAQPESHKPQLLERLVIDVSRPPEPDLHSIFTHAPRGFHEVTHPNSTIPVADLAVRQRAGLVDAVCLLTAFAGILALYAMFGGKLLLSKLDITICAAVLTLLYAQYFTLFTVMGGATPGMMFAGLRVVSFEGGSPEPSRLTWRSFGYVISGVTALLGFCWALADEDRLTWHDRISQTFIARINPPPERSVDRLAQPGASH